MAVSHLPYCTDEDLWIVAKDDYFTATEGEGVTASGDDGYFDPESPWGLRSDSNRFAMQGVAVGSVCRLGETRTRPGGWSFIVQAVTDDALTIRIPGCGPEIGYPPALIYPDAMIKFATQSAIATIASVSAEMRAAYRIADDATIPDPETFKSAIVYLCLQRIFLGASEQAGNQNAFRDNYYSKSQLYGQMAESSRGILSGLESTAATPRDVFKSVRIVEADHHTRHRRRHDGWFGPMGGL